MSSAPIVDSAPLPSSPWICAQLPPPLSQVAVRQSFHEMPPLSRGRSALSCGHSTPISPPGCGATSRTAYRLLAKLVASLAREQLSPALVDTATPLSVPA